ncbi:MAG: hypothetical protein MZV65_38835 [Chromatiales bacterium]|nr:hypothetical protein [Chromatiales bacterium]
MYNVLEKLRSRRAADAPRTRRSTSTGLVVGAARAARRTRRARCSTPTAGATSRRAGRHWPHARRRRDARRACAPTKRCWNGWWR